MELTFYWRWIMRHRDRQCTNKQVKQYVRYEQWRKTAEIGIGSPGVGDWVG